MPHVASGRLVWNPILSTASRLIALCVFVWLPHSSLAGEYSGSWVVETLDDSASFAFSAIAFDAAERPHISYHDTNDGSLRYAHHDGDAWIFEQVAAPECPSWGCHDGGTAIALDSEGRPHIVYYDDLNHRLNYAYRDEEGWITEAVSGDGGNGRNPSIQIDSQNVLHVSYSGVSWSLMYARRAQDGWTVETVDADGRSNSLALDQDDRPHISYFSAGSDHFLKHATFDGSSWLIGPVDNEEGFFPGPSNAIVIDTEGRPRIAYSAEGMGDNSHQVRLAVWDGLAWDIETIHQMEERPVRQVSFALSTTDRAHIAFAPFFGAGTLYYLHEGATGWELTTVDERAVAHLAIALGFGGSPSIGYVAGDDQALTYARHSPFAHGEGTAANPWLIESPDDLDRVRDHPYGHFELGADIDLAVPPYIDGAGFEPIGMCMHDDDDEAFTGSFDGAGFVIRGLFIDAPDRDCVGLFALADGALLRNLNLEGVDVHGNSTVGAVVGRALGTMMDSVTVSGQVTGQNGEVGGVVGWTREVAINDVSTVAHVTGALAGGNDVGGIVGNAQNETVIKRGSAAVSVRSNHARVGGIAGNLWDSVVEGSFSVGTVSGSGRVGGLVGSMGHEDSLIRWSYATGDVSASENDPTRSFGGLVGELSGGLVVDVFAFVDVEGPARVGGLIGFAGNSGYLERAYSVGRVAGGEDVGGLIGEMRGTILGSSYYAADVSGQADTGKGEPRASAEMRAGLEYQPGESFEGWFEGETVWIIGSECNGGYPCLSSLETVALGAEVSGNGTVRWLGDYPTGRTATLTFEPDEGHELLEAGGCGGALDGDVFCTEPLFEDCTVTVVFAGLEDEDHGGDEDDAGDERETAGCDCRASGGGGQVWSVLLLVLGSLLIGRRRKDRHRRRRP